MEMDMEYMCIDSPIIQNLDEKPQMQQQQQSMYGDQMQSRNDRSELLQLLSGDPPPYSNGCGQQNSYANPVLTSAATNSVDSMLSSGSMPSIPSAASPPIFMSDFELNNPVKTEFEDPDDFFNLNVYEKGRSQSFGGSTAHSQQRQRFQSNLSTINGSSSYSCSTLYDSSEQLGTRLGASSATPTQLMNCSESNGSYSPGLASPTMNGAPPTSGTPDNTDSACLSGSKKSTTRRNAWGAHSYADLITQAILASPEKRLTLSQVYEWMVQNVPYFADKGDSNSSAGWKNSIRHNLSLHSRFMRIQNEGAGKSSWWVINPDAKPGRNPRRPRANTMDPANKAALSKKTKDAKKKIREMKMNAQSSVSSLAGSTGSILSSHDIYDDDMSSFDPFRPRTHSNLSVPGSSARVSPSMDSSNFDDFEFPAWVEGSMIPSDILDRTDQLRIDTSRPLNGIKQEQNQKPLQQQQPQQQQTTVKSESVQPPPPSYHELNSVRGNAQLQNPLLRSQHMPLNKFPTPPGISLYPTYSWTTPQLIPPTQQSCAAQQSVSVSQALPVDLENLTLPDQPLMDMDLESVLRHELLQTRDHQINFDI